MSVGETTFGVDAPQTGVNSTHYLNMDQPVFGKIDFGQEDHYRVRLVSGITYTVDVIRDFGVFSVHAADGTQIPHDANGQFTVPTSGLYYVRLNYIAFDLGIDEYQLFISAAGVDQNGDFNGTPSVPAGMTIAGEIQLAADVDSVRFNVTAGSRYFFKAESDFDHLITADETDYQRKYLEPEGDHQEYLATASEQLLISILSESSEKTGDYSLFLQRAFTTHLPLLVGDTGDDTMNGGSGSQELWGWDGNDSLNGGAGADYLTGGRGSDVYFVDHVGDVVTEIINEGQDEVRTALGNRADATVVRYVLPAHVETLTGTLGAGQALEDNVGNNFIYTGAGADLIVMRNGGIDLVSTGAGADFIFFGAAFSAIDRVDGGGGAGRDRVGLHGDYSVSLFETSLIGIEKLVMWTSGDPGNDFDYSITTHDANVAAGAQLEVTALSLSADETLVFNGSAESDGSFWVRSGAGNDTIRGGSGADRILGGAGADRLIGNGGADRFDMTAAVHSTSTGYDTLVGFDTSQDRINVAPAFGGWGGATSGALSTATFDSQLAALSNGILGNFQAVKVTAAGGDLDGKIFVVFDNNGDGSYTAGQDLVWLFETPVQANLEAFNFFI